MLSILIPTYNYNITNLVQALHKQSEKQQINYEIIVMDDSSAHEFQKTNKSISKLNHVVYLELNDNIGRAKIRNKLADKASFPYLLFLDCDSKLTSKNYIRRYLPFCNGDTIVCGGTAYSKNAPKNKNLILHWRYGSNREVIPAVFRAEKPNNSFKTNNFLISKSIFNTIRFNENIVDYGHEDTLFGYELAKHGFQIKHIDNPVIHTGIEMNTEFIQKTKEGIKNLKYIIQVNGTEKKLIKDIKILQYYKFVRDIRFTTIVGRLFRLFEPAMYKNLTGKKPSLFVFDLYKLGYMCCH